MSSRRRLTLGQYLIALPLAAAAILLASLSSSFFSPLKLMAYLIGGILIALVSSWRRKEPPTVENLQGSIFHAESPTLHAESWWKVYAEGVMKDLAATLGESEKVFAAYDKMGLYGVVDYLKEKDPDLTTEEAKAVARDIIAEKNRLLQKAKEEGWETVGPEEEAVAGQERKGEKSWIDKWLQR